MMQPLGRVVETIVLSLLWLVLPAAPLMAAGVAMDFSYVRHYRATLRQCAKHLQAMGRAEVIARRFYNEKRAAAQSVSHRIEGECSHCGQCCLYEQCVFLDRSDDGRSKCRIYGNWFFGFLSCAEYPMTKDDIELYECPSFRAVPRRDLAHARLGRSVIPVVVRNALVRSPRVHPSVVNAVESGASTRT
ncbi:MAG: hypothetical protein H7125_02870 [Proteobacteria bacterium]|nr:hypothetical protein [Burkholderiales bacterium]